MNIGDNASLPDHDWQAATLRLHAIEGASLELSGLRPGDLLLVRTRHTFYRLCWEINGYANLTTSRPDRPSGRIRVQGCALGAGSTIAPDRLFCGGGLEFTSENGKWTHRTTPILELRLRQSA